MQYFDQQRFDEAGRIGVRLQYIFLFLMIFNLFFGTFNGLGLLGLILALTFYTIGWFGAVKRHRGLLMTYSVCQIVVNGTFFVLSIIFIITSVVFVTVGVVTYHIDQNQEAEQFPDMVHPLDTAQGQAEPEVSSDSFNVHFEWWMLGVGALVLLEFILGAIHWYLTFHSVVLALRMRELLRPTLESGRAAPVASSSSSCKADNFKDVPTTTSAPIDYAPLAKEVEMTNMPVQTPIPDAPVYMTVVQGADGQQYLVPVQTH